MKQDYKIPDWLTDDYFLKVLKSDSQPCDKIVLYKSQVESATNKGDNYASEMFRIVLNYTRDGFSEEKRIILKKDHDNEDVNKFFADYNLYSTEIDYYRLYLPEFEKILQRAGENIQLSPRLIYHEDPVFIMEDMAPQNYRTVSRDDRFDIQTAKLVLAKLAKYHAASMIYNKQSGGALQKLKGTLFDVKDGFLTVLLKKMDILLEDMDTWGEDFAPIIPKLIYIRTHYTEIGQQYIIPNEDFGVFLHGDAWLNNILVRFSDQKPVDVLLIDLQISFWSSPAYDLLYFIFTSLNEDAYQNCFDELIKHYYDHLSVTLKALNFSPVPSLMKLHLDIQCRLVHGIFIKEFAQGNTLKKNFSPQLYLVV